MKTPHDYFNPKSSFRGLSASTPAETRARRFFESLQAEHERAQRRQKLPLPGNSRRLAAASAERFLCAVSDQDVEPVEATIDCHCFDDPHTLRVRVRITDPSKRPTLPARCGLLLIEPWLLEGLFSDVPDLHPDSTGSLRESFLALLKRENLRRFPIARVISQLPEEWATMVRGVAEFVFKLPDVFELEKLPGRVHVVALIDRAQT
jgi:hypothetical protein